MCMQKCASCCFVAVAVSCVCLRTVLVWVWSEGQNFVLDFNLEAKILDLVSHEAEILILVLVLLWWLYH